MDYIGTSINVDRARLKKLQDAAKLLNISETELCSILLQQARFLFGDKPVIKKRVEYQKNERRDDFCIAHIVLYGSDYEFAVSRRYIFKISVSFIFRLAIDYFLKSIIYEWIQNRSKSHQNHKKHITNYIFKYFNIEHYLNTSAEYWVIPWPRE